VLANLVELTLSLSLSLLLVLLLREVISRFIILFESVRKRDKMILGWSLAGKFSRLTAHLPATAKFVPKVTPLETPFEPLGE